MINRFALFFALVLLIPSLQAIQLTEFFKESEFSDRYTGEHGIKLAFVKRLNILREKCGFEFIITSGYRTRNHPVEKIKQTIGTHTLGIAADIRVANGYQRRCIVEGALRMGFRGIGVHNNFIHIDMRKGPTVIWAY